MNAAPTLCPIWAKWTIGAIFLAALFFRHEISILAITTANYDDALFFRGVEHLLAGAWLGPYDNLTLAKGPMLSLIASASVVLGIPFKTFEFLIYLLVCLLFAAAAFRLTRSTPFMLVLFAALAWNPVLWGGSAALRFMREPLYLSFSMAVVGALAWALWVSPNRLRQLLTALGFGMIFGLFWLTREESIWLYPALGIILSFALLQPQSGSGYLAILRGNSKRVIASLLGGAIGLSVILLPILLLNYHYYGKFISNEFRSAEFQEAVGALMRIRVPIDSPYVSVSQQALGLAYAVSPAAAELRPGLGGSSVWATAGRKLPGVAEGEIAGGWFVWAVRGAAAKAGHHLDAASAAAFYRRLGEEINHACTDGRLPCNPRRDTLAPRLTWERLDELLNSALQGLWLIVSLESGPIQPVWSGKSEDHRIAVWREWLGRVAPPPATAMAQIRVSGWLAHPQKIPALALRIPDSKEYTFKLALNQAPGVSSHLAQKEGLQDMISRRFSLTTDCLSEDCTLLALTEGALSGTTRLSALRPGRLVFNDGLIVSVGKIEREQNKSSLMVMRPMLEAWKLRIMAAYEDVINVLFPALWILATFGLLVYGIGRRRDEGLNVLAILMLAALTAVATRAALVAYIDVVSFPAVIPSYLLPAYGFGIFYAVAGTYLLWVSRKKTCQQSDQ